MLKNVPRNGIIAGSVIALVIVVSVVFADEAIAAVSKKSVENRKLLASMFGGRRGWVILGLGSILTMFDYFHRKDAWIIGYFVIGLSMFSAIARWLSS